MGLENAIVPAVLGVVFAVIYFVRSRRGAELQELFQGVAIKRNGHVEPGKFLFYPKLRIPHGNFEILVESVDGNRNSPPYTYLTSQISPLRDLTFTVSPEHTLAKIGKGFGMQDIIIGSLEIDSACIIKSNDDAFIRNFLTAKLQSYFVSFAKWNTSTYLSKNTLRINVPRRLSMESEFEQLLEFHTAMLDRLKELSVI